MVQIINSVPGTSSGRSLFGLPDFGKVRQGFGELQPQIDTPNALQGAAVGQQQGLRGILDSLFGGLGQGQRARINQRFDTQANNAAGSLVNRGFAGSSANLTDQLGVESDRRGALGELDDAVLGQRLGSESGISDRISDLLFGSSEQSTQLLQDLLGSGGIGTVSRHTPGGTTSGSGPNIISIAQQILDKKNTTFGGGTNIRKRDIDVIQPGLPGGIGGIQGGGLSQPGFPDSPQLSIPRTQF